MAKASAIKSTPEYFTANRFTMDRLEQAAPLWSQDGGLVAGQTPKTGDGVPGVRENGGKLIWRITPGANGYRAAVTAAVAKALYAQQCAENGGGLKRGKVPGILNQTAEGIIAKHWTPAIGAAFAFLMHKAAAKTGHRSGAATNKAYGVETPDGEQVVLRTSSATDGDKAERILKAAFTCEACGHVNGKLVDADTILKARKAAQGGAKTKAAGSKAKAKAKAAPKAAKAAKVAAAAPVPVPASVTA